MGRSGVSEYHVFKAADQLLASGTAPTVDAVRSALGDTGSRSTINKYLGQWRQRQVNRQRVETSLDGSLRDFLATHATQILEVLEKQAEAKFAAEKQQLEIAMQTKTQQLDSLSARLESLQSEFDSLNDALEQERQNSAKWQAQILDRDDELQTMRENFAKENGRHESLEHRVNDKDKEIAKLQNELKDQQARSEILSEAAASRATELQLLHKQLKEAQLIAQERQTELKSLQSELKKSNLQFGCDMKQLVAKIDKLATSSKRKTPSKRAAHRKDKSIV